jgi:hypothetical protein
MHPKDRSFLTTHSARRCQQRGFNIELLEMLDRYADMEIPAGNGCYRRFVSRGLCRRIPGGERLFNRDIVESSDGQILTVQHRHGGRGQKCRYTRRGWKRNRKAA